MLSVYMESHTTLAREVHGLIGQNDGRFKANVVVVEYLSFRV